MEEDNTIKNDHTSGRPSSSSGPISEGNIDRLAQGLYSRSAPDIRKRRHLHLRSKTYDVKTDWEHPPEPTDEEDLNGRYEKPGMSFFTKILIASIIFFVIAVSIGAYLIFKGSDIVSANNIDITMAGPVSVAGGEPLAFTMNVSNKNSVAIQVVNLDVEFPVGTADPANTSKSLKSFQVLLPDIGAGGSAQQAVNAVLFGEQNSTKTIAVTVDYRVAGSNATFSKEKDFDILINSSPLTLSVDSFSQINAGQELDLDVSVTSNSKEVVKNLLVHGTYPFGFTFTSSSPKVVQTDNSTWAIGDLPPGSKQTIHIKGKIDGQDGDTRVFKFAVGVPNQNSATTVKTIGTEYISGTQTVTIQKPFLSLGLALDGDSGTADHSGQFDKPLQGEISWFNNLSTSVIDGEIDLKLSGTAYDKGSVNPIDGFYDSANNQIVWNKVTTPTLGSIGAGESGHVDFTFVPRNLSTASNSVTNPEIDLSVGAKANRISESSVPEEIDSSLARTVKVSSNVALASEIVRSTGPFQNTGAMPPRSEQDTTYTVIWTVYNTSSTLDGVQVTATLPPYVKWVGTMSPAGSNITYNAVNNQITWNIGNVAVYAGQGASQQQVMFQIDFKPGANLVGQTPVIMGSASLVARDDFTGETLTSNTQSMTTRFSTDPAFVDEDAVVGQ